MAQGGVTEPLLPNQRTEQNQSKMLEREETGGIKLPWWAVAAEVKAWVQLLTKRDMQRASFVTKYDGYEETAYRYVFHYKEQYKHKKLQNLITILPSGNRENDEPLKHNEEAGLIAYTKCQEMEADLARLQHDVDPFVWETSGGKKYTVVQTWPVEVNPTFRKEFEVMKDPDTNFFDPMALQEFKTCMKRLFQLPDAEDAPVMAVQRKRQNTTPLFVGKGLELMAMLRVSPNIRKDLMIESLVEPNGFIGRWECEGRSDTKVWKMDLTSEYFLYVKRGWDTMTCFKPKEQFEWDCKTLGQGRKVDLAGNTDKTLPYVMDLDWFAPEAYKWALRSAGIVWTCAVLMVLLRWHGPTLGWNWVRSPLVLAVATGIAGAFALFADFSAMRWCIVPWLQKVRKLAIMRCTWSFRFFLTVQLSSTFLQVLTIQNNAWFMVTAVEENDTVLKTWGYLWSHSMFEFLPKNTWENWITPKSFAVSFWCLSLVQLILPWMTSVRWPGSGTLCFPTRNATGATVTDTAELVIKEGHSGKQEERPYLPETYYNDFHTLWSKLVHQFLELWNFQVVTCTYRESISHLALASGLRYLGSVSLSYPTHRINEIIDFKEGYSMKVDKGLELLPPGWEMRALKEFQKLARCHCRRLIFIMFCKLALQMNLQITFFIIIRIQEKRSGLWDLTLNNVIAMISIWSLLLSFTLELFDVMGITVAFFRVDKAVKPTFLKVGQSSKAFAFDDFKAEDNSDQRIIYSGKDLKQEYYAAWRLFLRMILIIILSTWLIGYALLKAFCSVSCEHGAWEMWSGCLSPIFTVEDGPTSYCFASIF